jgi:hypothetical protein
MLTRKEKRILLDNWADWCRGYVYHRKEKHEEEANFFRGGMHSLAQSLKVFDNDINDTVLCAVFRYAIEAEGAEDILEAHIFWS